MISSQCQISSALVPKFKLNWASLEKKTRIKEKLVEALRASCEDTDSISFSSQSLSQNDLSHPNATDTKDDDFFAF